MWRQAHAVRGAAGEDHRLDARHGQRDASGNAANWGTDADPVDSVDFELHLGWLGAGKIIIENLAGLAELPVRCRIVVAPLKVRRANGGPARVLAFIDE